MQDGLYICILFFFGWCLLCFCFFFREYDSCIISLGGFFLSWYYCCNVRVCCSSLALFKQIFFVLFKPLFSITRKKGVHHQQTQKITININNNNYFISKAVSACCCFVHAYRNMNITMNYTLRARSQMRLHSFLHIICILHTGMHRHSQHLLCGAPKM